AARGCDHPRAQAATRAVSRQMTYRDRPIECPRCRVELQRADTHETWRCAKCKGVLSGVAEVVTALVAVAPELVDGDVLDLPTIGRRTVAPALPCSVCGGDLEPVFLGGVELDRCYHDQLVWFDRGELALVLETARTQKSDRETPWLRRL